MPRVQYSKPQDGINKVSPMPAPKNISDIKAWVRMAKKHIPEVPCIKTTSDWMVRQEIIDAKMIVVELFNTRTHDKASLVFDRQFNTIAGR